MRKTTIFPSDKRIELDGGINTKFERSIILDNESPSCANVVFENGAVKTREGITKQTVSGFGSGAVFDAVFNRLASDSSQTMIAFVGGSGYYFSTNTFITIPSAQSVYTSGQNINGSQYQDHLFIGNGGIIPYKYNGTDFTRHGIYPPVTAPTGGSNGTGALNGYYAWKVTYVNSQLVESDVSPVSDYKTITAGQATITIPVAPQSWGVASRRVYRTVTSGTTFLRVATVSDNSTTSYTDNIADASLGTIAPSDQGVPPLYSASIYFRDRLFVNDPSNPNLVWYSDLAEPYTFGSSNFIRIGDDSTDIVQCFGVNQNGVIVFCNESYTFIYMPDTDPNNWSVVPGNIQYGCKSPRGVAIFQDKVVFPAIQRGKFIGFAAVVGAQVQPSSTFLTVLNAGSYLQSDKINPDMFEVQEAYVQNISAIVYKDRAFFTVTQGSAQTQNNKIWVYEFSIEDLSRPQKFTWVPWTGIYAKQFVINSGNLYLVDSNGGGHLRKAFNGAYNDDSSAIDSYIWTKEFGGAGTDFHYHKDFRNLFMLVDQPGSYYMNVNVRIDSDNSDGDVYNVDLSPGGMLWGDDWGSSTWGGGQDQAEKKVSLNQAGKRVQFRFSNQNTVNQRFAVHAIGFSYNKKGIR